jgi:hypothetical protein
VNAQKDASALAREIFHGSAFGVNQRLVEDVLIERAIGVIEEAAERVGGENAANDIRRRLERATPEMVVLAAITKTALKGREQDVNIARIRDVSVHAQRVGDIPPAEREKRFAVYKKILEDNWQKKGQEAAAEALHGLEEGFLRSDTEFFELQIAGKPVAFMRFDQRPDLGLNDLYGGSFNVIPELAGSALGSVFLHETLREKGKDHRLHVHVLATDRLASVYVEEFGFTITGLEREPSATGESVSWFKIERAPGGEKPPAISSSLYIGSQADMSGALDWVEDVTNDAIITNYIMDKASGRIQMRAVPKTSQRQAAA